MHVHPADLCVVEGPQLEGMSIEQEGRKKAEDAMTELQRKYRELEINGEEKEEKYKESIKEKEAETKAAEEEDFLVNADHNRMYCENRDMRAGYTQIDELIINLKKQGGERAAFLQTEFTKGANPKPLKAEKQPSDFCIKQLGVLEFYEAKELGFNAEDMETQIFTGWTSFNAGDGGQKSLFDATIKDAEGNPIGWREEEVTIDNKPLVSGKLPDGTPKLVFIKPTILPVPEFVVHIKLNYTPAKAKKILDGLLEMHKLYLAHADDGTSQSATHTAHSSQRPPGRTVHHRCLCSLCVLRRRELPRGGRRLEPERGTPGQLRGEVEHHPPAALRHALTTCPRGRGTRDGGVQLRAGPTGCEATGCGAPIRRRQGRE